jgi:probable F420-dependent oxidoreductase
VPTDSTRPPFRFGVSMRVAASPDAWAATCRRAESLGYSTVLVPDHLGTLAPFPLLIAAADATERLRVGTFVLNNDFHNPWLLAREVATTDLLTGGRLELGIGAGHMKAEYDTAGIRFEPGPARVARLAESVGIVSRLLADEEHHPHPMQRPRPPLLIGGNSDGILRLAAAEADILGLTGLVQARGEPPGSFRLAAPAATDERIRFFRACAGQRAGSVEVNALVQRVIVTADRRGEAERTVAEELPYLSGDELLETPFVMLGTVEQLVDQMHERRERFGITYVVVFEPSMEALAPVVERLSGR